MQSSNVVAALPAPHQSQWNKYFTRFGCISCGQKSEPHDGHGFCLTCRDRVVNQLRTILRESR